MNDEDEPQHSRNWMLLYGVKLLAGILAAVFVVSQIGEYMMNNITHP